MSQVHETIDHLFRRESGRIVAYLTRYLGPDNLDLAENAVQDALVKAIQAWPLQGIPENPAAWIMQVSKNGAIDSIRSGKFIAHNSELVDTLQSATASEDSQEFTFDEELKDDQLKLMFICCHPILSKESRIALTLKTVCGFSVPEIAKAFLSKEETIAQRIVRAKQKISGNNLKFEVPAPEELESRLHSVLDVLYLLFNEGYSATDGENLIRRDLCEEAIYRTRALSEHPICHRPAIDALLALMYFQVSRFNSRLDPNGELQLLEDQDRTLWDQQQIAEGFKYLDRSAEGEELTEFHLQAGIASCHASAESFEKTNWKQILSYYDILLIKENSPIVALNRAVATAMIEGPEKALKEIDQFKDHPSLRSYYLLPATIAELSRRKGDQQMSLKHYQKALNIVGTTPEKRLIEKRIRSLKGG